MATAAAGGETLRLPRPDDWHLHIRDGDVLTALMKSWPGVARRAIVMPNLKPPVTTTAAALAYRDRILAALPAGCDFEPLMTLYLTDDTPAAEIDAALASGAVAAVKLYPAGATTNSAAGVTDVARCAPALARMAEVGMPLLIHGEVTDADVDVFEREAAFLARVLPRVTAAHPRLRIVLEHVTTAAAVAAVEAGGENIAATITPQHLLFNRNALFEGGLRPHRYCLPVLKTEADRAALVRAATGGSRKFFLGTDSAPHGRAAKECACGAAGSYSADAALELYATVFDAAGALPALRAFACENGPDFYRLPRNAARGLGSHVALRRADWAVPDSYDLGGGATVVPLAAGQRLGWCVSVEPGEAPAA